MSGFNYNGIEVTSAAAADKYVTDKEREEYKVAINRLNELQKAVEEARLDNIKITARLELRDSDYRRLLAEDRQTLINMINQLQTENEQLKANQK